MLHEDLHHLILGLHELLQSNWDITTIAMASASASSPCCHLHSKVYKHILVMSNMTITRVNGIWNFLGNIQHQQFRRSVISRVPEFKRIHSIHRWKDKEIVYNFHLDHITGFQSEVNQKLGTTETVPEFQTVQKPQL